MCRFSKYTGAGNDFVIVRAEEVRLRDPALLARRICPRRTGVGVDGLVLLRSVSPRHVRVRFFNPDGSEFSTCGNGSRCAARYASDRGLAEAGGMTLVTDAGEVGARVHEGEGEGEVTLEYRQEAEVARALDVEVAGRTRRAWLVRIGTPHLVVPLETVPEEDFEEICRPLRRHPGLGTEGANVDLVALRGPDRARIRTFERGVEGETLACGSGAMAATLALRAQGLCGRRLSLLTRSGETLGVTLREGGRIELTGPARPVFDGVFPDPW